MGPMNEAALCVPDVFAKEAHGIAFLQIVDPWCELYVVLYEHRLAGREPNDNSLVRTARAVVAEYPRHDTLALDLNVASALLECLRDRSCIDGRQFPGRVTAGDTQHRDDQHNQNDFHRYIIRRSLLLLLFNSLSK